MPINDIYNRMIDDNGNLVGSNVALPNALPLIAMRNALMQQPSQQQPQSQPVAIEPPRQLPLMDLPRFDERQIAFGRPYIKNAIGYVENQNAQTMQRNAMEMNRFNAATELARLQEAQQRTQEMEAYRKWQMDQARREKAVNWLKTAAASGAYNSGGAGASKSAALKAASGILDPVEAAAIYETHLTAALKEKEEKERDEAYKRDAALLGWTSRGFQPVPLMPQTTQTAMSNVGTPSYMRPPQMPQMLPQTPLGEPVVPTQFGPMYKPQKEEKPKTPADYSQYHDTIANMPKDQVGLLYRMTILDAMTNPSGALKMRQAIERVWGGQSVPVFDKDGKQVSVMEIPRIAGDTKQPAAPSAAPTKTTTQSQPQGGATIKSITPIQ